MKKLITFLTALVVITTLSEKVKAQAYKPFPTDSASWDIGRCWYFYLPGWYDKYTISIDGSDTLYDGFMYKTIYITEHHLPGTVYDTLYPSQFFGGIREVNKQIFIFQKWASVDTTPHLVYDFQNTNVGDTIFTSVLAGSSATLLGHLVAATDSVLVGTQYHKRLHLQDPNNVLNTEDWIEGIGSSWGLPFASFWSITDNSYDLVCYKTEDIVFGNLSPTYAYCLPPLPQLTCDSILTVTPETSSDIFQFSLFPVPAIDIVTIDINSFEKDDWEILVYNNLGSLVMSDKLEQHKQQIKISNLINGLYIVEIKSKGFSERRKLIIQ